MLTDEERKEFTTINAAAFDLLRVNAKGVKIPCWLCMSTEAKEQARKDLLEHVFKITGKRFTEHQLAEQVGALTSLVNSWQLMETERKAGREQNDPQAFFV